MRGCAGPGEVSVATLRDWAEALWWNASVADWLQGVGSILAVGGAWLAYREIRSQITQAERHHKDELKAAHRPFVVVREAWFERGIQMDPHKWYLRVRLVNIGPGFANQLQFFAWLRDSQAPLGVDQRKWIEQRRETVDKDRWEFFGRFGGLGSNESMSELVSIVVAPSIDFDAPRPPILFWRATFTDVFKNEWPEDRSVVHILMPEDWKRKRPAVEAFR